MNWKKLLTTSVIVFVAVWFTNFLIHGVILKPTYEATANLWRTPEEMHHFMVFMVLGQIGVSLFLTWIFAHGYRGTGWKEGVRFGLLMGAFCAASDLIMHALTPYPLSLTLSWIGLGFAQMVLVGILASWRFGSTNTATA